jgi:hypothetical protein
MTAVQIYGVLYMHTDMTVQYYEYYWPPAMTGRSFLSNHLSKKGARPFASNLKSEYSVVLVFNTEYEMKWPCEI